ncbi:universal stress protein [Pontimicrobium sp. MEBiC01747]|jgi:nucleotide-binding universal stress UspA family protein
MKNILLPTDFSENSWNAIKYALQFFSNEKCNFYILHVNRLTNLAVNDTPYITSQPVISVTYEEPIKEKLKKTLKRISETFSKNNNHKFYTLIDNNFFTESIRQQVEEKKIDIIVVGTKGATGLKKHIVGSNTGNIITKVQCNTLVIPENTTYKIPEEIAFPTDYALQYNIELLNPISEILNTFKAALRVLHISRKKVNLNTSQQNNKELLEDYFNEHTSSFHFLTNKKVEDAIQCFVQSRDIDMIVMVAKNLNYFQKILFHPTVEEISYHTDVPFLVLHE